MEERPVRDISGLIQGLKKGNYNWEEWGVGKRWDVGKITWALVNAVWLSEPSEGHLGENLQRNVSDEN